MKRKLLIAMLPVILMNSSVSYSESNLSAVANYSGFAMGLGVGYTHSITNDEITTITNNSDGSSLYSYQRLENISNGLSPMVTASYYWDLPQAYVFGIDLMYKYIGIEQFNVQAPINFANGANVQANLRTKLAHELYTLLTAGYEFDNWMVFLSLGPSFIQLDTTVHTEFTAAGDINPTQYTNLHAKKITTGGAAQVGFEYMLPHRFAVQMFYSFSVSPVENEPATSYNAGAAGNVQYLQRVQVIDQSIGIVVNKYF